MGSVVLLVASINAKMHDLEFKFTDIHEAFKLLEVLLRGFDVVVKKLFEKLRSGSDDFFGFGNGTF